MASEGEFPKSDGDILYGSEANDVKLFTGDGSDGAFSENSGTTNLTQGTTYQYTSFLLDTSATLSASSTSTSPIIIRVQGNVTINGTINLVGKGCAAQTGYGTNIATAGGNTTGGKRCEYANFQFNQRSIIMNGTGGGNGNQASGGGGGGASSITSGSAGGSGGSGGGGSAGGAGGCTIFIICGGTLTFGASSSIDVSGQDGQGSDDRGSGGGGSGDAVIIHKGAKTDNGVTITTAGGAGGTTGTANGGNGAAGNEVIELWEDILWN